MNKATWKVMKGVAKALGCQANEADYWGVFKHKEWQLHCMGMNSSGSRAMSEGGLARLRLSTHGLTTCTGNQISTPRDSITVDAHREPASIARDIERRLLPSAKEYMVKFQEEEAKDKVFKGEVHHLVRLMNQCVPEEVGVIDDEIKQYNWNPQYRMDMRGSFSLDVRWSYRKVNVSIGGVALTPFAKLHDEGIKIQELRSYGGTDLTYSSMSVKEVEKLFLTWIKQLQVESE